ncbi:peptide ABC transporter substrate-binding protein [bacterium]|nr:peptide ABC transporter substrate-binding protein [bacterium]
MNQLNNEQSYNDKKNDKFSLAKVFLGLKIKIKKFLKKKKNRKEVNQENLDKKLVYSLSSSKIPKIKQLKHFKKVLTKKELKIVNSLLIVVLICFLFILGVSYKKGLQSVPAFGGEYTEGVVGLPKYINPLYSFSDVDSDLSYLIFSSLFKYNNKGEISNDLVKKYSISEDGKIYNIEILENVKWHDGEKLDVDDIVFTFQAIKNSDYRSPLLNVFQGVEIEKIDDFNLKFTLNEPYIGFVELLNFGILPQHMWQNINPATANLAELNLKPIGSGPYKFKTLFKNKSGELKEYILEVNDSYYKKPAYIEEITFKFYLDFETLLNALNEEDVDGISYLPKEYKEKIVAPKVLNFNNISLAQINSLFLNSENNNNLDNIEIRKALALAINKDDLINNVLEGAVVRSDGPILNNSFAFKEDIEKYSFNLDQANKILDEEGWKIQEVTEEDLINLEINKNENKDENLELEEDSSNNENNIEGIDTLKSLTVNTELEISGKWRYKEKDGKREYLVFNLTIPENKESEEVSQAIRNYWDKLGVRLIVKKVSSTEIQEKIIKEGDFEIFLYGEITNFYPDPFVYWHSGQSLNITNYENEKVDKALEEIRLSFNLKNVIEKYYSFQDEINSDIPAIFLYTSSYNYPQDKKIKNLNTKTILEPRDRFSNVTEWYIKTKNKISFKNIF